jgi:hypothetical protein
MKRMRATVTEKEKNDQEQLAASRGMPLGVLKGEDEGKG